MSQGIESLRVAHEFGRFLWNLIESYNEGEISLNDLEQQCETFGLTPKTAAEAAGLIRDSHAFILPDDSWIDKMQEHVRELQGIISEAKVSDKKKRRRRRRPQKRRRRSPLTVKKQAERAVKIQKMPFNTCMFTFDIAVCYTSENLEQFYGTEDSWLQALAPVEIWKSNEDTFQRGQFLCVLTTGDIHYAAWITVFDEAAEERTQVTFYRLENEVGTSAVPKALVRSVNDEHGTYAITAKPPTGEKHAWEVGDITEPPEEFYKVHLQSGYVSKQKRTDDHDPQEREYSHRWRVRGHSRLYTERGQLPISEWKLEDLTKRGYVVYSDGISGITKDHRKALRVRGKKLPTEGEWLALRLIWIDDQIRGPEDKPLIESVRIGKRSSL